jgi:hypothetical protein
MKVNVNIITDFSFGFLLHKLIPPPPAPPIPSTMSIEMPATFLWTMGFLMNQNKFTNGAKPVTHKGVWIALDGHDCGMAIPDLTIPPAPNLNYPIGWLLSSRKPTFAASTVKMNGTSVACAQWIGLPPLPMMTCGDPLSAPVCWSALSVTNTVSVGMTLTDLLAGLIAIAASMITDYIFSKIPFSKLGLGNVLETILGNSLKGLSPVSILAGFATSALTGNATFTVSIGLPFAGGTYSYTPNPSAGSPSSVFGGALPFVSGSSTGQGQAAGTPVKL